MKMTRILRDQTGIKMKKLETIRKEERKIRKFIRENINVYKKNQRIKEKLDDALIADMILIWVQGNCEWTPLKWITGELK